MQNLAEERTALAVRKEGGRNRSAEMLRMAAAYIELVDDDLDEEAERHLNRVLETHAKKAQVFMVVASQYKIRRMTDRLELVDKLLCKIDTIVDDDIANEMSVEGMRRLVETISKSMQLDLEFVHNVIEQNKGNQLPKSVTNEDKFLRLTQGNDTVFTDPVAREMLRTVIQKLETLGTTSTLDVIDIEEESTTIDAVALFEMLEKEDGQTT